MDVSSMDAVWPVGGWSTVEKKNPDCLSEQRAQLDVTISPICYGRRICQMQRPCTAVQSCGRPAPKGIHRCIRMKSAEASFRRVGKIACRALEIDNGTRAILPTRSRGRRRGVAWARRRDKPFVCSTNLAKADGLANEHGEEVR